MPLLKTLARGMAKAPGYTLMRGLGRFATVRRMVAAARRQAHAGRLPGFLANCEARLADSLFALPDPDQFLRELEAGGLALGLRLPPQVVEAIERFAQEAECHADRVETQGFTAARREQAQAQASLGKPILLAQFFNAATRCPVIGQVSQDPLLHWLAARHLGSVPRMVGVNLWWTFPVQALEEDRDRHAHLFHRDVDDFRFLKFFFYVTDVEPGDGAHVCVVGSQARPPARSWADRWVLRRYTDEEVTATYPPAAVTEICGPAGTGFAENTLCIHKGRTPTRAPRLLLQVQFALFDYGVLHDRRAPGALGLLPAGGQPA
ncbi:hypothetical protein [Ramlibacter sp.]|uniref:hypothetical protein n=1 Tax=Ramlibacter sp. TaxID=1917967 RepID=UPI002D3C8E12|nr:hypothetical protein [Ramlibacter sp.]HYD74809.1 hypothetical protein [Ramlibacter sp.]